MPEAGPSTLVIRLHSLGDVVLASAAVRALSETSDVFFLTREEYAPVVERMPGNPVPLTLLPREGALRIRQHLRNVSPALTVDLQGNLTTLLGTCPHRRSTYSPDRKLRRAVLAGRPEHLPFRSSEYMLTAGTSDTDPAPHLLRRSHPPRSGLVAGIVVGGRWPLKNLPDGHVEELCRLLVERDGAEVVLLGEDEEAMHRIASGCRRAGVSVSPPGGISTLLKCIESLHVLISPDSGPAHAARALGVPVLVVFTSTSPALGFWEARFPGIFTSGDLPCRPCHRHGGRTCFLGTRLCRAGLIPLEICEAAERLAGL